MYIVKIKNGNVETEIHGVREKLTSGNVVKGINSIDSFSFSLLPSNVGFNALHEFKTLVSVYNTNKNRYDFYGRVLYSNPSMSNSGLIKQEVTCESYFGFLCDSVQEYVDTKNWTVRELLQHIIDVHNSQLESYKHFAIGEVTVTDPNDNLYLGIQRENSWETIKKKLIDKLGGELRLRVVDGVNYIDYLTEIGETRSTEIALSKNMKAIVKEKDPSAYVTRLIPLGSKKTKEVESTDELGNVITEEVEIEERIDITEVNNGLNYIDDEQAIEEYGLHLGYVEFDDVNVPSVLMTKGQKWLAENNKVLVKYSITALDLSLIGLDIDDYDIGNRHPVKNKLIFVDDIARIIKCNIDVCEETKSTIEVGEMFKTLGDIQAEQAGKIAAENVIEKIEGNYVTNEKLRQESNAISSLINQTAQNIAAMVASEYTSKSEDEAFRQYIESQLSLLANEFTVKFTEINEQVVSVDGDLQTKFNQITKYFTFDIDGLTIGQIDNPNRVVIDNDEISILVNGVVVQSFDSEGKALVPELKITRSIDFFGFLIDQDAAGNVNCEYRLSAALLNATANGTGTLLGATLNVDDAGNGTIAGATVVVDKSGNATLT